MVPLFAARNKEKMLEKTEEAREIKCWT